MSYTTAEESRFETRESDPVMSTAIEAVNEHLAANARISGYTYMINRTYVMTVRLDDDGTCRATAEAVFAKFVLIEEPNEGDMDGKREAREPEPESKDYGDLEW